MLSFMTDRKSDLQTSRIFSAEKTPLEKEFLCCTSLTRVKSVIVTFSRSFSPNFVDTFLSALKESENKIRRQESALSENEYISVFQISALSFAKKEHSVLDLLDLANKIKKTFGEGVFFQLFNPRYFLLEENNALNFMLACNYFLALKKDKLIADKMIKSFIEVKNFNIFNEIITLYLDSFCKKTRNIDDVMLEFKKLNTDIPSHFFAYLKAQYLQVKKYEEEISSLSDIKLTQHYESIRGRCKNKKLQLEDKLYLLAAASLKIDREFGIFPHSTQILTVLALTSFQETALEEKLDHKRDTITPKNLKGCLAQVKTGEGKSIINTILALCFAMEGKCVDIITSSKSLSMRDQAKFKNFFKSFGVKTSHICDKKLTEHHFSGQIIYGINTDFEFALLREQTRSQQVRCYFANPKEKRPCEVVLVDEVDNLFIDKSSNSAIIATEIPNKQQILFECIFRLVKQYKQASDLPDLEYLCETMRKAESHNEKLSNLFLKISNTQLKIYIHNAAKALWELAENENYVVQERDFEANTKKINKKEVIIIDRETGDFQEGSRWHDGLHEFLELKHGMNLREEIATFASLCHPVFFEKYQEIYGLTGTVGSLSELKEIEFVYHVKTIQVPTYSPSKRVTLEPIICDKETDFQKFLLKDILTMQKEGRPTLILCQTIEEILPIEKLFVEKKLTPYILDGQQVLSESFILNRAGTACSITISTNLASRGTDIILTPESEKNGGLHVILTYFPESERVEDQAIGRAGRQGQLGSSRIIIPHNDPSLKLLKSFGLKKTLSAIVPNISESFYEIILLERKQKINHLSEHRTFRSNIEKINHSFSEVYFDAFGKLHDIINDEFITSLVKKHNTKYTTKKLFKSKQDLIEKMTKRWGKFFHKLGIILQESTEEYSGKGMIASNYKKIEALYCERAKKLFNEFKSSHSLFFTDTKKYFLSFSLPA